MNMIGSFLSTFKQQKVGQNQFLTQLADKSQTVNYNNELKRMMIKHLQNKRQICSELESNKQDRKKSLQNKQDQMKLLKKKFNEQIFQLKKHFAANYKKPDQQNKLKMQKQQVNLTNGYLSAKALCYSQLKDLEILYDSLDIQQKHKLEMLQHEFNIEKTKFINQFNKSALERQIKSQKVRFQSQQRIIKLKNQRELQNLCIICLDRKRSHMATPCNHFMFCEECSKGIKVCPFCMQQTVKLIKIFI